MKSKILNFLLIITSLLGYLEWGGNNHIFLFKAEAEIFSKLISNPISVIHPFTVLPLISQVLLIITIFQNKPSKRLIYISMAGLGLLLGFMFIIGIKILNFKIIMSTIPFIIVSIYSIYFYKKIEH